MKAKYYIYRNLNKGGFSIKYKGKVIKVYDNVVGLNVTFKVSDKGRQRVLKDGRRNVHAYAVCTDYIAHFNKFKTEELFSEVKYNPYKNSSFMLGELPIVNADRAYFTNGKCYI